MDDGSSAAGGIGMVLVLLVELAIAAVVIAGLWKVFVKAGQPGWAAIVPIYNIYIMLTIVGRPVWWIVLYLIPCVSLVAGILVAIDLAKAFGKSTGFGIGLVLLPFVFIPMLGFGDATFQGAPNKAA